MSFDRDEFRRKAVAAAKAKLQEKKMREESGTSPEKISQEEMKVIEAYRRWKQTPRVREEAEDDGATAPAPNATEIAESKEQRIARLKRKVERRRRVQDLKNKLAEKRNMEKPDAIRDQAKALKERIQKVRTQLRSMKEEGEMPANPVAPPAGAMTAPAGAAIPGQEGMSGAVPNLPPEITAEIQNIATAAQALAQMAGVAPAAPQLGADVTANIPSELPSAATTGMLPESARKEQIARIKKLIEQKKAAAKSKLQETAESCPTCHCAPCECNEDEKMIEEARTRAKARREALRSIRQNSIREKSYEAEERAGADVDHYIGTAMDSAGTMGDRGYEFLQQNALQKAGVKHDGASPSMPGRKEATSSIRPAKVWPAKDLKYGGKVPEKMPATPDVNPVKKGSGQPMKGAGTNNYGAVTESADSEAWDSKAIDHYLERRELNFKALLAQGRLG